jgi:replication factor A1
MKISEVQINQRDFDITGTITDKSGIREFSKFGRTGRVCNCVLKDESGEITLVLWNEEIDKINEGDKVKITNGYVKEYQGAKQVSVGKFGSFELIK